MDTGTPAGTFGLTRTRTRKNRTRVRVGSKTRTGYPRVLDAPGGLHTRLYNVDRRPFPRLGATSCEGSACLCAGKINIWEFKNPRVHGRAGYPPTPAGTNPRVYPRPVFILMKRRHSAACSRQGQGELARADPETSDRETPDQEGWPTSIDAKPILLISPAISCLDIGTTFGALHYTGGQFTRFGWKMRALCRG
ncbi:hypothetical protein B0H19DRAFT_1071959 [Mycena capillaripes]|nr:hypothetical protein B0H19DRAFT_1071959 [Mycena capillaripes]